MVFQLLPRRGFCIGVAQKIVVRRSVLSVCPSTPEMSSFESQKAAFQKLFADFGESKMIHFRMSRSDVTLSGPGFESQRAAFQKLFADFGESKMVHFRMSRSDVTLSGPGFESQKAVFQKLFTDFGESKNGSFSDVTLRCHAQRTLAATLRSIHRAPSGPPCPAGVI